MLESSSVLLFEKEINVLDLSFLMSFIFSDIGNDQTDSLTVLKLG